jgi:hypothetical protein
MTESVDSVDSIELDMKTKNKTTWVMTNFVLTCLCGWVGEGGGEERFVRQEACLVRLVLQHVNYLRAPTQRFIAGSRPALLHRCLKSV